MEPDGGLSLSALCEALSISRATGKNWLRLGKIVPDLPEGRFSGKNLERILEAGRAQDGPLRRRSNKQALRGRLLYRDYIQSGPNRRLAEALLDREWEEADLRLLLANFAAQLELQRRGVAFEDNLVLPDFLTSREHPCFLPLVEDLLGGVPDAARLERLRPVPRVELVPEEDTLGFLYLSLQDLSRRRASGGYYTPRPVAEELLDQLERLEGDACDPCCGSGSFLLALAARGAAPERLYGQDKDPVSVSLARINLALLRPGTPPEVLRAHIRCADSLEGEPARTFDLVVGNPPWGRERPDGSGQKRRESCVRFLERGLALLRPGGVLAFVLPEALLTVSAHREARELLARNCAIRFVRYLGEAFPGVQCPAVLLGAALQRPGTAAGCRVSADGRSFVTGGERRDFALHLPDREAACLEAVSSLDGAVFLAGHARFALGIVTGNNRELLRTEPAEGWEPVLRGGDVRRYALGEPKRFIRCAPERFQQAAPLEVYRAPEKLVYRFISRLPVFALDCGGRLTLNSCNILIPQLPGLEARYLLAVLNSGVAAWYLSRRFRSVKLLRQHLQALPIPRASRADQREIVRRVEELLERPDAAHFRELEDRIAALYRLTPDQRALMDEALAGEDLLLPPGA